MATSNAKVNFYTDPELKDQAEVLFEGMGLNMTTALNMFLHAAVQSGEIPFPIRSNEAADRARIQKALVEAQIAAADPNTAWYTHDEVFGRYKEKYGL